MTFVIKIRPTCALPTIWLLSNPAPIKGILSLLSHMESLLEEKEKLEKPSRNTTTCATPPNPQPTPPTPTAPHSHKGLQGRLSSFWFKCWGLWGSTRARASSEAERWLRGKYLYIIFISAPAQNLLSISTHHVGKVSQLLLLAEELQPGLDLNNRRDQLAGVFLGPLLCLSCTLRPPGNSAMCLASQGWGVRAGRWGTRQHWSPAGRVWGSAPLQWARGGCQTARRPYAWSYRPGRGGELHVSRGSCLFIIAVAPKWSRQGSAWSHFLQRTAQTAAAADSQWFHFRSRKHPRMVKTAKETPQNTEQHTHTHTHTHTPKQNLTPKSQNAGGSIHVSIKKPKGSETFGWMAEGLGDRGIAAGGWRLPAFFEEGSSERKKNWQFSGLETESFYFRELKTISFWRGEVQRRKKSPNSGLSRRQWVF